MGKLRFHQGLKTKFLYVFLVIVAVSCLISCVIVFNYEGSVHRESLRNKGASFARYVADLSKDPLLNNETVALDNIVKSVNNDSEVAYAFVYDLNGNLLTGFFPSVNLHNNVVSRILNGESKKSLDRSVERIRKDKDIQEVTRPVIVDSEKIGEVVVGLSEVRIKAVIRNSLYCVILGDLAGFLAAFFLVLVVQRKFINPVIVLADLIKQVSRKKDYTVRAQVLSRDELGELSSGFNDMIEQIELREALLENHRNNLEKLVSQRTEELTRALAAAEAASKTKSDFLANMSHEIRTPMNSILGFSNLLSETNLDEVQMKYAENVRNSGQILLVLINDILDISKIEAGKIDLEAINFDLEHLVEDLVRIISPKFREKNLDLSFFFEKDMDRWFKGDPTRIRQVILNLVNNAVKFTEKGEIVINVRRSALPVTDNSRERVEISVKDSGIGIPKDKQAGIFQMFTQADTSITRKFGGTGLGLSISRSLAKMMGGDITVSSVEGEGSDFVLSLLLEKGDRLALEGVRMVSEGSLKDKSVAIIDGHQNARQLIVTCCEQVGMKVVLSLADPKIFIERLLQNPLPPDIIISDMIFSGMSGMDLARQLRRNELFSKTKILALTSDPRPGTAKEAQTSGFDAYLQKPVLKREMIDVIMTMLGDQREVKKIVTRHTAGEVSLKGIRVLVAEDTSTNWELLKVYFKMFGCEGDHVWNGQEAVDKVKSDRYDLCLMDVQMPVMDGLTATRIIRSDLSNKTPIVALTAAVMKEDKERAFAAGVDDFLVKPLNKDLLKAAILKWGRRTA